MHRRPIYTYRQGLVDGRLGSGDRIRDAHGGPRNQATSRHADQVTTGGSAADKREHGWLSAASWGVGSSLSISTKNRGEDSRDNANKGERRAPFFM